MEDMDKLEHLLEHWIEHNEEHAAEFSQWAVKANDFGEATVHDEIMEAANQLQMANEALGTALKKLNNHQV